MFGISLKEMKSSELHPMGEQQQHHVGIESVTHEFNLIVALINVETCSANCLTRKPKSTGGCQVHDILLSGKWITKNNIKTGRSPPRGSHYSAHPCFSSKDFHKFVRLASGGTMGKGWVKILTWNTMEEIVVKNQRLTMLFSKRMDKLCNMPQSFKLNVKSCCIHTHHNSPLEPLQTSKHSPTEKGGE